MGFSLYHRAMLQSALFTKTKRENPKDEVSKNARLLIRAGFVDKLQAGVYTFLPLGLRVLKKIESIVRGEMECLGGQEIIMPALQPKESWEKTGRWQSMDNLYKLSDSEKREFALGPTHEEVVVPLLKEHALSYKDLPKAVYQFQTKFRMEERPKSGLLRGREFLMKDMYSFHANQMELENFYGKVKEAYLRIFEKCGIGELTYLTLASGGSFSKYSHEFQTLTPAGEDTIYICSRCSLAVNKEIFKEGEVCPGCREAGQWREEKAIEVGNIFDLKTRFSQAFDYTYKDELGNNQPVLMGCYGLGLARLMGTVVEVLADDKGLVWPESIAPFSVHLISLGENERASHFYKKLTGEGVELLYDDRDLSAGEKFAEADLFGIPRRLVVSSKGVAKGEIEWKDRKTGKITYARADL